MSFILKPYQSTGVEWMISMEHQTSGPKGGFLCDEMGLGKTVQIIATILKNPKKHTLIVVPKSLVNQWLSEFKKFASTVDVGTYEDPNLLRDVVIASYPSVYSKKSRLHTVNWDRIVLDEAHEIRNRNTRTFKSVNNLYAPLRWVVTGTPVFNSMEDFVTLCAFIGFSKHVVQAMHDQIKDIYILRRTKADGLIELPYCHFENVELDMFENERAVYDVAFAEACESINFVMRTTTSTQKRNMHILECLLRMRQIMRWPQLYNDGIAKINEQVAEPWIHDTNKMYTLRTSIDEHPDEKSVVFCSYKGEMDHIQSMIKRSIFRIDGSVEKEERDRVLTRFKESETGSVLVVQIKCGGQGLNIQCATRVYIMAPSWNPATELQAIGRCHRTGQTREVFVKKLVYKDTQKSNSVDMAMMSLQGHKSMICADVLNDKRVEDQIPIKNEKSMDAIRKIFR
jgi:SNF2 family DNA or RNA helicase